MSDGAEYNSPWTYSLTNEKTELDSLIIQFDSEMNANT